MFNIPVNDRMPPNDKSNAFLHAFWCAMNLKSVGSDKARAFAAAHEWNTPVQLNLETNMDNFNNEIGFNIANAYSTLLSNHVYQSLQNGELRYLSNINYSDIYFWGGVLNGIQVAEKHGITILTKLIETNK